MCFLRTGLTPTQPIKVCFVYIKTYNLLLIHMHSRYIRSYRRPESENNIFGGKDFENKS